MRKSEQILRQLLREYSSDDYDDSGLKPHVKKALDAIDRVSSKQNFFVRLDRPIEKAEVIAQFAEKVGIPRSKFYDILGNVRQTANEDDGEDEIDYDKDEFRKFQEDVDEFISNVIEAPKVKQALSLINKYEEKEQLINKFMEIIGVPKHKMYELMTLISKVAGRDEKQGY